MEEGGFMRAAHLFFLLPPPPPPRTNNATVVGDENHVCGQTLALGLLGGQTKIQAVARVVFHNQQRPGASPSAVAQRGQHSVWGGRRKDVSADGGRQHALPDKTSVRRLVSAAAAADQRHSREARSRSRSVWVGGGVGSSSGVVNKLAADDNAAVRQQPQLRVGQHTALQRLVHGMLRLIHKLWFAHHAEPAENLMSREMSEMRKKMHFHIQRRREGCYGGRRLSPW